MNDQILADILIRALGNEDTFGADYASLDGDVLTLDLKIRLEPHEILVVKTALKNRREK